MSEQPSLDAEQVRAAEVIGALSLATDLGIGVPLEHGLHSTLIAMRLIEGMGIEKETATQTYYACLLFYIGCTAGAETAARLFGSEDALTTYTTPTRFGSRTQMISGFMRALAPPGNPVQPRAVQIARGVPRAARAFKTQVASQCEGQMRRRMNENKRRSYAEEAARYDMEMDFFERRLLGVEHRVWACDQAVGETLEVALGTGLNLPHYPPDVRLTGLDMSPEMLAIARTRAQ